MQPGQNLVHKIFDQHLAVIQLTRELAPQIEAAGNLLVDCLQRGGKVLWAGNGGSASDAQHLSAELIGRFVAKRIALPSVALSTDTSALTAISNDYGFAEVFARQISGLGRAEDLFIGISTSGNSPNIVRAFEEAAQMGMKSVALSGRDGGKLAALADVCITIPSDLTARIQEAHILIGHILCEQVDEVYA